MSNRSENEKRIKLWEEAKLIEWQKGGKLRQRFPDVLDLRAWMAAQIDKAKMKATQKAMEEISSGCDTDGKKYDCLDKVWSQFAAAKAKQEKGEKDLKDSNNTQTRAEWYERGASYWENADATVDGVLGGYGHVSPSDIHDSKKFLESFGDKLGRTRAADLGAGIGRITKDLLLPMFNRVDLIEQDPKYVATAEKLLGEKKNMGSFMTLGLQDYIPEKGSYDVIWVQWVLGHLPDTDLKALFRRCKEGLREDGIIVVKENIASKGFIFDKEDMSVTRSEAQYKAAFKDAGLKIIKQAWQTNFPTELFKVKMFALR